MINQFHDLNQNITSFNKQNVRRKQPPCLYLATISKSLLINLQTTWAIIIYYINSLLQLQYTFHKATKQNKEN